MANGDGRLRVQVSARSTPGQPINYLTRLRFDSATNARLDIALETGKSTPYAYTPPPGTRELTFFISRATPGQASTLNFVVTDHCGEWPTFAGGAAGAF
jgi:hypothetical protein